MAKTTAPHRPRVGIPDEVHTRFKARAVAQGKLLRDVYSEAVRLNLTERDRLIAAGRSVLYLRAAKNIKAYNIELLDGLLAQVQAAAERDEVSVRAVLYHAFVMFDQTAPPA